MKQEHPEHRLKMARRRAIQTVRRSMKNWDRELQQAAVIRQLRRERGVGPVSRLQFPT